MDSFKIVATWEKKGIYFCVVPHRWEYNGILLWPEHLSHSQRETLRANAATVPEEGWAEYSCVLKCSGISLFGDALAIEKKLTQCIDTDAEETFFLEQARKKKPKKNISTIQQLTDRNDLFLNNVINQHILQPTLPPEDSNSQIQEVVYSPVVFEAEDDDPLGINILHEVTKTPNVGEEMVLNEITNLKNEFCTFKTEIKQQIKDEYFKINLSLDKIFRILSSQNQPPKEIVVINPKQDLLQHVKFPLYSCEQILELEHKIRKDVEFREQLIEFLSKIGGRTGLEDGSKIAYKVVDCVFQSEVLMQYSWTGVSRGTSGEKKSFQMLDGILGVFFEVISLADNRHTQQKNCAIFKEGVLKHAKKRTARKRLFSRTTTAENTNSDPLTVNNLVPDENKNVLETNNENETDLNKISNDTQNTK